MSCKRFLGKIAIVTGAAQGVGRAAALRFAQEGATVLIADRALAEAEKVKAEIEKLGGTADVVDVDLETCAGASSLVERVVDLHGRIDVSTHNVGGTIYTQPLWEYSPEEIEQEIQRSLWPTLWCSRAVVPQMIRQNSGVVINIGSVGTRGIYRVPYAAAKGGVEAITKSLALEVCEYGIRINCVAPGGVDVGRRKIPRNTREQTKQELWWQEKMLDRTVQDTPMKRFSSPEEQASAIAFLASDDASYITGQTLYVAGGAIG